MVSYYAAYLVPSIGIDEIEREFSTNLLATKGLSQSVISKMIGDGKFDVVHVVINDALHNAL